MMALRGLRVGRTSPTCTRHSCSRRADSQLVVQAPDVDRTDVYCRAHGEQAMEVLFRHAVSTGKAISRLGLHPLPGPV